MSRDSSTFLDGEGSMHGRSLSGFGNESAKSRVSQTKTKTLSRRAEHSHSAHDMSDCFEKIELVMREKGIIELDI